MKSATNAAVYLLLPQQYYNTLQSSLLHLARLTCAAKLKSHIPGSDFVVIEYLSA